MSDVTSQDPQSSVLDGADLDATKRDGGSPPKSGRPPAHLGRTAAPAPIRLAGGKFSDDLRAILMVWKRELIRFRRNGLRIATSIVQPVLYLFVLGTGLSSLVGKGMPAGSGFNFKTFMFPGIVCMTILFTSIFSSISIVWDREFGFLREMLVAPVRRSSLVIGKCIGGATTSFLQAVIMLALAGLVGVPYTPLLMITLIGEMLLLSLSITALGIVLAARMKQLDSFAVVMQFVVLPLYFLSGALFPLRGLPGWLEFLTRVDPMTYAVDPMRRTVLEHLSIPEAARSIFAAPVTWFGWQVPIGLELGVVAAFGAVMLGISIKLFSKMD
ncbi:MAG: ABC transporter permease [Acidimicrobiales bacterium]